MVWKQMFPVWTVEIKNSEGRCGVNSHSLTCGSRFCCYLVTLCHVSLDGGYMNVAARHEVVENHIQKEVTIVWTYSRAPDKPQTLSQPSRWLPLAITDLTREAASVSLIHRSNQWNDLDQSHHSLKDSAFKHKGYMWGSVTLIAILHGH